MAGDLGSDELLREWQSGGSALGADAIGALVSLLKNASSEIRRGEVRAASRVTREFARERGRRERPRSP